uniref:Uncharacterized protein n=1 Tax=Trichogramma kaykai TaxID=54128 RepID=A0ABD2WZ47_9HYME
MPRRSPRSRASASATRLTGTHARASAPATRCVIIRSCIGICHPTQRDTRPRIGTCHAVRHHQVVRRHLPPDPTRHPSAHRHLPRGASSPGRASAFATRLNGTRARASAPATRCVIAFTTCAGCVTVTTRSGHLARLLPRTPSSPSCSFRCRRTDATSITERRASRSCERAFPPLQVSSTNIESRADQRAASPSYGRHRASRRSAQMAPHTVSSAAAAVNA